MTAEFHAMEDGVVTRSNGASVTLRTVDAGVLRVPSGLVEASDPFDYLGEGLTFPVPPGEYPVVLTMADVSPAQDGSLEREAYLSLKLADGDVDVVKAGLSTLGEPEDGVPYGVSVDEDLAGFADHVAASGCVPTSDWYDEILDVEDDESWISLVDSADHIQKGVANIVMPWATAGENVVMCQPSWGRGFYPVMASYDSDGTLLGLHIQLIDVDNPDGDPRPRPPVPEPGFWSRLKQKLSS